MYNLNKVRICQNPLQDVSSHLRIWGAVSLGRGLSWFPVTPAGPDPFIKTGGAVSKKTGQSEGFLFAGEKRLCTGAVRGLVGACSLVPQAQDPPLWARNGQPLGGRGR